MIVPIYCLTTIISSGMSRLFNVDDDNVADDDVGTDDVGTDNVGTDDVDVHTRGIVDLISNQCTFIVE